MNRRRLFVGCFISLIATAFGFAVRGAILDDWGQQFNLSQEDKGVIQGVGLFPFAISIILISLVIDRIGYGTAMMIAFVGHVSSALLTIFSTNFQMLYVGTFIYALSNGVVEAVINPVVATMYDRNKTHWLNVLHAGWPGGLVLGGLLAIGVQAGGDMLGTLPGRIWQWQMALVLIPTLVYGVALFGQKFPVQERVAAGVSYKDMLREFGWGSAYICSVLLIGGVVQIVHVTFGVEAPSLLVQAAAALVPTVLFALYVRSFGRPMFVFLLLVMFLLATTELGTDSWIADIMRAVLQDPHKGTLFLVYTSLIMFVLRFFAGPLVHRISPLGLLTLCAAIACGGLLWLANAGSALSVLLMAATFYAFGKTFFWPTTLGVVSEQYPRGGALMMNAIAGVGMLAVGVIGSPAIGTIQDHRIDTLLSQEAPAIHTQVMKETQGIFGETRTVDPEKAAALSKPEQAQLEELTITAKQGALGRIAILPGIMFVCYLGLLAYFRSKGGYRSEVLTGHAADDEKFTGGVAGPVEA